MSSNRLANTIRTNSTTFFGERRSFYQQRPGLAMGNRLAPILAILYMNRIENQATYSDQSFSISIHYRYITPVNSTEKAVMIQHHLNCQDSAVQFKIELPCEDGFLPFLNTKSKVNASGVVETGWHTKSANKGLMLNVRSHHSEHVKRAAIDNTIKTYTSICSNDALSQEVEHKFEKRA